MRKRDFFHTGLDVSRSECQRSRLQSVPCFGDEYVVDGTDGNDGDDGTIDYPVKTIQEAVTRQIAVNNGKGDIIWVLPGWYEESIVGDLVDCSLIGVGVRGTGTVRVRPTDSYAFHGGLIRSLVENIEFWTPSTDNPEYPAFYATYAAGAGSMMNSIIDNCRFMGGNASSVIGLQIGARDTAAVWESGMYSKVTNCGFFNGVGVTSEFETGISVFAYDAVTYQARKQLGQCHFYNNIIFATENGIVFYVDSFGLHGTVIEENKIRSHQEVGPHYGIRCSYNAGGGDQSAMVINNRICAQSDAIYGFKLNNVQGNIVSLGAAAPDGETGFNS